MNEKHPPNANHENGSGPHESRSHGKQPRPSPQIYVASLADYNNGALHGVWIDAAREPEEIKADIDAMLAQSPQPDAEEYLIFDSDQFGHARVYETDAIDLVARIARGIKEHGYAFSAWADVNDGSPERLDDFEEAYLGHYDSVQDYVDRLADDLGYADELAKLPESLHPYIRFDAEALARDMELGGDIYVFPNPKGGLWIFRGDA